MKPLLLVTCQHDVGACERAKEEKMGGRVKLQLRRNNGITTEEDQWDNNQRGPMELQLRRTNGITAKEDFWAKTY